MNDVLTVSEVAEYLRVNPQTVYRKAKAGELPAVRIGRAIRFRREELEEWIKVIARSGATKQSPDEIASASSVPRNDA